MLLYIYEQKDWHNILADYEVAKFQIFYLQAIILVFNYNNYILNSV